MRVCIDHRPSNKSEIVPAATYRPEGTVLFSKTPVDRSTYSRLILQAEFQLTIAQPEDEFMTFGQIEREHFEADFWPFAAGSIAIDRLPQSMPVQRDLWRSDQERLDTPPRPIAKSLHPPKLRR